jgi:hypothetical protein
VAGVLRSPPPPDDEKKNQKASCDRHPLQVAHHTTRAPRLYACQPPPSGSTVAQSARAGASVECGAWAARQPQNTCSTDAAPPPRRVRLAEAAPATPDPARAEPAAAATQRVAAVRIGVDEGWRLDRTPQVTKRLTGGRGSVFRAPLPQQLVLWLCRHAKRPKKIHEQCRPPSTRRRPSPCRAPSPARARPCCPRCSRRYQSRPRLRVRPATRPRPASTRRTPGVSRRRWPW